MAPKPAQLSSRPTVVHLILIIFYFIIFCYFVKYDAMLRCGLVAVALYSILVHIKMV